MNNKSTNIRARFAPAPTGMMHLGNIRTALINFLFARQKKGTFVLRIEDTDAQRNFDPQAKHIISDLTWLNLDYDEGPIKGGQFGPYFQSQRTNLYKKALEELIKQENSLLYRCFCSQEDLERKRERQIALKQPPRYDRTCLKLSETDIKQKLKQHKPFIWRVKVPQNEIVKFQDLSRGILEFDLKNFSDFPITREDGSFTFIFANCIDDIQMKMTHVFRGEDHISNTVDQIIIYKAFNAPIPIFWHMPIICDVQGKKLSKRNFGFSLKELQEEGYLPEAICNYLAIIGGSFEKEIQTIEELIQNFNFDNMHASGQIKYDVEKLNWVNHKWIAQYNTEKFLELAIPFLKQEFPEIENFDKNKLLDIVKLVQGDCITLKHCAKLIRFYFETPEIDKALLLKQIPSVNLNILREIITNNINFINKPNEFLEKIKTDAKAQNIKLNIILPALRFALTGSAHGPHVNDLLNILPIEESKRRIESLLKIN